MSSSIRLHRVGIEQSMARPIRMAPATLNLAAVALAPDLHQPYPDMRLDNPPVCPQALNVNTWKEHRAHKLFSSVTAQSEASSLLAPTVEVMSISVPKSDQNSPLVRIFLPTVAISPGIRQVDQ